MRAFFLLTAVVLLAGCSAPPAPPPATPATLKVAHDHGHDHKDGDDDHARDKMMLSHLGKYHAGLTAHISAKDGNELDILVESLDDTPTPVALAAKSFAGTARRDGDPAEYPLAFEPAPADERPKGEAAGTCSHYVAKAPFLKPDDTLTVTVEVEIDGRKRKCVWKAFAVKQFTHHAD